MEKWRSKGKDNSKDGSLLPPTRRLSNTAALRVDKKKEKKWTIGGFFKRISSTRDSNSSSSEEYVSDPKKYALSKKKLKKVVNPKPIFDHIVLQPVEKSKENNNTSTNTLATVENNNAGLYVSHSQDSLHFCRDSIHSRSSDGSLEGLNRKIRRDKMKARVEARRALCADSSSDEDSYKSNNSLIKVESDGSLQNLQKNDSCNRKSRAARTERYIKRVCKDDCSNGGSNNNLKNDVHLQCSGGNIHQFNNEKCRPPIHPRFSTQSKCQTSPEDTTVNSFMAPSPNFHPQIFHSESYLVCQSDSSSFAKQTSEQFTNFNNSYKRDNKRVNNTRDNQRRQTDPSDIVSVTKQSLSLQIANLASNQQSSQQKITPPEPPPRDPQRRVFSFGSYDTVRPNSYSFDNKYQHVSKFNNGSLSSVKRTSKLEVKNPRSYNSDDEITWFETVISTRPRPSSVNSNLILDSQEFNKSRHSLSPYHHSDENNSLHQPWNFYKGTKEKRTVDYSKYSSESKSSSLDRDLKLTSPPLKCKPCLFQKDQQFRTSQKRMSIEDSDNASEQSRSITTSNLLEKHAVPKLQSPPNPPVRRCSYINSFNTVNNRDDQSVNRKRNSKNLEEALSELEAIYNSLRLGDEDLLERAEQRSMEEFNCKEAKANAAELVKDLFETTTKESSKEERSNNQMFLSKPETPDRMKDDMAYRRMHPKERPSSLDGQASLSKISYLFASPILSRKEIDYIDPKYRNQRQEPDVTRDDVVFRSINYANSMLKVIEPQPPFGIPLGPVTSATSSDYLHTVPDKVTHPRSLYIPKCEPNIVTDDLAFRNLRKDAHKVPSAINNDEETDNAVENKASISSKNNSTFRMKKKRAVRSLSANLYGLINKQTHLDDNCDQPNFHVASKNINLTRKSKLKFTADSDKENPYRFNNIRQAMSDTESSQVDTHWSRSIDSNVDINGNCRKNIFQKKIQVYVPPSPKDDQLSIDDVNRQSSTVRESGSDYEAQKLNRFCFVTDKSLNDVSNNYLPLSSNVTSARHRDVEPFTELEISKYKQLCQDLENLVQLANEEKTKSVNVDKSSDDPIALMEVVLSSNITSIKKEKLGNEMGIVQMKPTDGSYVDAKDEVERSESDDGKVYTEPVNSNYIDTKGKVKRNEIDKDKMDMELSNNTYIDIKNRTNESEIDDNLITKGSEERKDSEKQIRIESSQNQESEEHLLLYNQKIKCTAESFGNAVESPSDDEKICNNNICTSSCSETKNDGVIFDTSELKEHKATSDTDHDKSNRDKTEPIVSQKNTSDVKKQKRKKSDTSSSEDSHDIICSGLSSNSNVTEEELTRDAHDLHEKFVASNDRETIKRCKDASEAMENEECDIFLKKNTTSAIKKRSSNSDEQEVSTPLDLEETCTDHVGNTSGSKVMVAAGATALMAASESNSSNGTESSSSQGETQPAASRCSGTLKNQEGAEYTIKKNAVSTSSNVIKHKNSTPSLGKVNNRLVSRVEGKESSKNLTLSKMTPIRETKTSRLRAASIISPNGGTSWSRRSGSSEMSASSRLQPSPSLHVKEKSPISSDSGSTASITREKDKSHKRKSYLNRSLNTEEVPPEHTSHHENTYRRSSRLPSNRSQASDVKSSSEYGTSSQSSFNVQRKYHNMDAKDAPRKIATHYNADRSKTRAEPITVPIISSSTQRTSGDGHDVSEVSRRVDALTALTRATMERVERLTLNTSLPINSRSRSAVSEAHSTSAPLGTRENRHNISDHVTITVHAPPTSPSKCSILKKSNDDGSQDNSLTRQLPVSILKHKAPDDEAGQSSSNLSHPVLPVTFSSSVVEPISKRHGILKKRSSLDESEILRRRSCSPDVSFAENNCLEFRPILKNQRRSSLDEIVKRSQSPDLHPVSILKRKSSREDDREDRLLGSPEPQSILKRKSGNNTSSSSGSNSSHHVSITAAVIKAAASGAEYVDGSEVRPILKKKHSREESSFNDLSSLEPRPILKKKSSTESDEHDDKPKKTILKCSRKSSQEDSNNDACDVGSPKKLSVLRNRLTYCKPGNLPDSDSVRPILKQSSFRDNASRPRLNFHEDALPGSDGNGMCSADPDGVDPEDLFLRKRAQSVGHVQASDSREELAATLNKRRSLESVSLSDVQQERPASRHFSVNKTALNTQQNSSLHSDNTRVASTVSFELSSSTRAKEILEHGMDGNRKNSADTTGITKSITKHDPKKYSINNSYANTVQSVQMADGKHSGTGLTSEKLSEGSASEKRPASNSEVSKFHSESSNDDDETIDESRVRKLETRQVEHSEASVVQEKFGIQRSNSVSQMASHFKALEEQVKAAVKESTSKRAPQKGSRGVQRYRERKEQGIDRFNTQPVTYQEVQEAVLHNKRNTSTGTCDASNRQQQVSENSTTTDDEFDPSKLSLAERVRLFNQKIATETTALKGELSQETRERSQRRRPTNRYKTQPVTSEEVEVACRTSPINVGHTHRLSSEDSGASYETEDKINSQAVSKCPIISHVELPKGILKSSCSQTTYNTTRAKMPELEGFKLLKSVLKKESEEHQPAESHDTYPRSILKNEFSVRSEETALRIEERKAADRFALKCNRNVSANLSKVLDVETYVNASVEQKSVSEFDDVVRKHGQLYRELKDNQTENSQVGNKHKNAVPYFKSIITQKQSHVSETSDGTDITDNVKTVDNNVKCKQHIKQLASSSADETPRTSDDEASSSGGREIHSIIRNEAVHRRRQAALAKQAKHTASSALSKSASHHAISSENASLSSNMRGEPTGTYSGLPLPGLCRSATQPMPGVEPSDLPGASIADRLAALQRSGTTDWKRRVPCEPDSLFNQRFWDNDSEGTSCLSKDDLAKQGVLADRLGKLESAAEGWRKRVAIPDVVKFSVAGKMKMDQPDRQHLGESSPLIEATGNGSDRKKKRPRPERFRGRRGILKDAVSTPSSPSKETTLMFQRSFSEPVTDDSGDESILAKSLVPTVSVPRADDETFTSFFSGVSLARCKSECLDVTESDFDNITSYSELLVQKRTVQTQRRRVASKNPLKVLAARTDLKTEYTEVRTGVAEEIMRSVNIDKLAKNSSLAVEALAGLASTEDFSAVTLRNVTSDAAGPVNKLCAYKDLMLILVKGRRHVQVRLVKPVAASINSGDNYILVTRSEVYNYVGKYSNVIERARGAEIALCIQQNKDLGCLANQVITVSEEKLTCTKNQILNFWKHLGADGETVQVTEAGHPDEDELYESALIDTNMVYEILDNELVPLDKYWGAIPKIEMLHPSKILVFDFGSEMYIWNGKMASMSKRKVATHLAEELWEEGYDYTECTVCSINAASLIGRRPVFETEEKKGSVRPKWCLLAKLTQHVETILFREKFLDWPDFSRVIRMKGMNDKEQTGTVIVEPSDVNAMIESNKISVDLVLEGSHLGRGSGWYDEELMRQYLVTTLSVTVWHIDEFSYTLLNDSSAGQFYTGDSYIVRWSYTITTTGRELSGQPSKHSALGRDRYAYFIWQGQNASLNEQGSAALLTIELDHEQGPQVRVVQGFEPAAFLNLFAGKMVVHSGKKAEGSTRCDRWRLYICQGTLESEVSLVEVPLSARQLRSQGSLILLDTEKKTVHVWHGCNTLSHVKQNALHAANELKKNCPEETGLTAGDDVSIYEVNEKEESEEFFNALGGMNRMLYVSLQGNEIKDYTPRLFHLSSISGEFMPTELLCPHRANLATPFPFLQDELYQVNQPALFLLDNKDELWVWQGWWPDNGHEDQTGSGAVRWQAERRATMTMAIQYWQKINPESTEFPVYLVWAGLEPLRFTNLFPVWMYRDDIAELNIKDGRKPGELLTVENELALLTQSTYPPAQLLQRPLPEGVDPTRLELYLSPHHFQELLGLSKEEFQELPVWKQMKLKKEIGLF